MFILKYFSILTLLMSSAAFATDIRPDEKLGQLQVTLPKNTDQLDSKFNPKYLNLVFRVGGTETKLQIGKENLVAAGEGCLDVAYGAVYQATQCGVKIEDKKLTKVALAAIRFAWNKEALAADFGPQPIFYFSTTDQQRQLLAQFNPSHLSEELSVFVIPDMTVAIELQHDETGSLYKTSVKAIADTAAVETIQPPELRGALLLDFIGGKPVFDTEKSFNSLAVVYRDNQVAKDESHLPPSFMARDEGSQFADAQSKRYFINYYKYAADGVNQTTYAYPIKQKNPWGTYYELTINEHVLPLSLTAGQTTRIPVATLNVHHYKSNLPGFYRVFSDYKQKGILSQVLTPVNVSGYSDLYKLLDVVYPTETSLFYPIGYNFRLDFYITDATGRTTLQDQVNVDLTHE
ncbi:MAG: hypothetical protein JSU04_05065 [Bdellovibrionales bacterium]|nr:hypothetical protein [Bdellovibrionales bacterium]